MLVISAVLSLSLYSLSLSLSQSFSSLTLSQTMTTNEKRCNKSVSSRSSSSLFAKKVKKYFPLQMDQSNALSYSSGKVLVKKMKFVEKSASHSPLKNLISFVVFHTEKRSLVSLALFRRRRRRQNKDKEEDKEESLIACCSSTAATALSVTSFSTSEFASGKASNLSDKISSRKYCHMPIAFCSRSYS